MALIINLLPFLLCSLILVITFIKTNEWIVRFVVSFVFGLGGLITFIPLVRWLMSPRNLVIVEGTQIILPRKNAKFLLCDISNISAFENPNHNGANRFWSAITKYGCLTIRLKNGKKYSLNYIENILEVEVKLQSLLKKEINKWG